MSTITRELAKLFRKITNSEIDAEGNAHVVLSPADSLLINNARIALESLEAEAVAYMHHSGQVVTREECCDDKIFAICCKVETPLYAAPQLPQPAVLSVPAAMEMDDDFDSAFEHGKAVGWNAYRAAMLQAEPASNSDELPPDYLQGHKDGLEWAAQLAEANHPQTGDWLYDDPIELARAIRKGPDMPTVQDGNSPVTPDGWIPVSDRMPETDGNYWGWWSESKRQGPVWFIKSDLQAQFQSSEITHWMPLPAAPQQEVKSALEHGMQRYAGAMQKLAEGDK
ncbi:TPA: DUF551 domain-containing protein [Citrobacter freundii]|nr:DUF551 domain-containing protein [Citrobacter freundii]